MWICHPDGTISSTTQDKATSLMTNWFPPVKPIPGSFTTDFTERLPQTRPLAPVTKEEVLKALKGTSNTSAPGLSKLNYQVLKWAEMMFPEVFLLLISSCIRLGHHHSSWKKSMIITFPKPNKPSYTSPSHTDQFSC